MTNLRDTVRCKERNCPLPLEQWSGYSFMTPLTLIILVSWLNYPSHNEFSEKKSDNHYLDHAMTLSPDELIAYVNKLAKEKNMSALRAISQSGMPHSEIATAQLCEVINTEEAICLCTTFDVHSTHWRAAMFRLRHHPKKKVIGYIKQMATSSIAEARWCCYEICRVNGWNDLIEQAKKDQSSKAPLNIPSIFDGVIGETARHYLDTINKK